MHSNQRHGHRRAIPDQRFAIFREVRAAKNRIAEIAWRQRLEPAKTLGVSAVGGFGEESEFIFEPDEDLEPHRRSLVDDLAKQGTRTDRSGIAGKLAQDEQALAAKFVGKVTRRFGADVDRHVRITGVPAAQAAGVVRVESVVAIPADQAGTQAETPVHARQQIGGGNIFAAHHAVDVGDAQLQVRKPALFHHPGKFRGRLDLRL